MIKTLATLHESGEIPIDDDHEWGYQLRMVNNDMYSGKLLVLENTTPGSMHYHKNKTETFIVLMGTVGLRGRINHDGGMKEAIDRVMKPGDRIDLPPLSRHQMWNVETSTAVILEVATHDDDDDTYRVEVES